MNLNLSQNKSGRLRPFTRIEIEAIYDSIGAEITGKEPSEDGWILTKSPLRKDVKPSFGIQVESGNWIDHGTGETGNIEEAVKQYYRYDDHQIRKVYKIIQDIVGQFRANVNTTGKVANFSVTTDTHQPDFSEYHTDLKALQAPDFWEGEEDIAERMVAKHLLELSPDHPLIKQVHDHDKIEYSTLLSYKCGIQYFQDEDYLLMPYDTGGQLYRREERSNQRITINLPGSRTKASFFGSDTVSGCSRLHLCKSPRETMLMSQYLKDEDCIGICGAESPKLSDYQKLFLYDQFKKGCQEVYVYFDCDTEKAKKIAHGVAHSIKRISGAIKVFVVDIHSISGGTCKDLADWVRVGKHPADLMSSDLDEVQLQDVSEVDINDLRSRAAGIKESLTGTGQAAHSTDEKRRKPFWVLENSGRVKIHHKRFIDMLESHGFMKVYFGAEPVTVRMQENVLSEINQSKINDHVRSHIENLAEKDIDSEHPEILREEILNAFFNKFAALTGDSNQLMLRDRAPKFLTDEKKRGYLFYKNGVVEVTAQDAQMLSYSDLDGVIWENQIINRDIAVVPGDASASVFSKFVEKLAQGNADRESALKSSLGYLMHTFKDKPNARAVILTDEKLVDSVDEAHGGTGKSLLIKSLDYVRQFQYLQGKNFQPSHQFAFQNVCIGDQIILIDDVRPDFDFEGLFNVITDDMAIEQKYKTKFSIPFHLSPKIAITTNTAVGGTGNSFSRRQNIVELPDYFNGSRTVDQEFGHTFFDEWDAEEWNRFDNFMISCMQFYLQKGLLDFKKNYAKKKLIIETSPEIVEFFETEVQFDWEYDKKELYRDFLHTFSLSELTFKQSRFTDHIKKCGDAHPDVVVRERRSGSTRYIEFASKNRQKDSNDLIGDDSDRDIFD